MIILLLFILFIYILLIDTYPILIASIIICLLFLFSISEHLQLGVYILSLAPAVLLIWKYKALKDKAYWISRLGKPDIILFLTMFFVLYGITRFYTYTSWDEFSHWGLVLKNIYLHNKLPDNNSTVVFLSYPPGNALFQYWVTKILGYSEGNAIFAQSLLLLLGLTTLFWKTEWSDFNRTVVQFVAAIAIIYALNGSFTLLTVDTTLSVFFGMGIVLLHRLRKDHLFYIALCMLPIISVLYLIKNAGIVLGAVIVLISCILYFFREGSVRTRRRKFIALASFCILLASLYLPKQLWSWHLEAYGVAFKGPDVSISAVITSLGGCNTTDRNMITLINFKKAIFSENILRGGILNGKITLFIALCFIFTVVLTSSIISKDAYVRKQLILSNAALFFGLTFYLMGLLVLYALAFTEYEGVNIAGFMRYSNIYTMGWLLYLSFSATLILTTKSMFSWKYAILLTFVLATLTYLHIERKQFLRDVRDPLKVYADYFKNKDQSTNVYFIHNDSDGFEKWIFLYELTPLHIQRSGWSLGLSKYGPGDVWTNIISVDAWKNELKQYDYLVVSKSDEKFWDAYGTLFRGIRSNGIYRIIQGEKNLWLSLVRCDAVKSP